jgi:hypothetical protein
MGKKDKDQGGFQLSRRDFLKVAGAGAAGVAVMEPLMAAPAAALTYDAQDLDINKNPLTTTTITTCPYCSAQCGQRVVVGNNSKKVYDIYGDVESPTNNGGLCAKGAGSLQLVNNSRRLGVPEHTAGVDGKDFTGAAWKRTGNGSWTPMTLAGAMSELAPKLVTARGSVTTAEKVTALFTAPQTIGTQQYLGFGGLRMVAKDAGSTFVLLSGTKVDATALGALLLAGDPNAILGAFDELLYTASDPAKTATYRLVSQRVANATGSIGAALLALGRMANTTDLAKVKTTYHAYVCDTTGEMHDLTSPDMVTWTYVASLGHPTGVVGDATTGLKSPSVLTTDGVSLKVWSQRFTGSAVEDNRLFYSSFNGTAWTGPTLVTYDGVDSAVPFDGHPKVTSDGRYYTLYHNANAVIMKAKTLIADATPAAFGANTTVYSLADTTFGNLSMSGSGLGFAQYALPDSGLGWAYSSVKNFAPAYPNSKGVMFFGSSHINNEANFIYRKIIANFGTSNVEHQARI